jgi:hypothetical protein
VTSWESDVLSNKSGKASEKSTTAKMNDDNTTTARSSSTHTTEKTSLGSSLDAAEGSSRNAAQDEEKHIGTTQNAPDDITPPSKAPSRTPLPHTKSLHSTISHQSRAGADGYTCFDAEPPNNSGDEAYLVQWENGDADPLNPRSMTKVRRWVVVCIISASSLCA